MKSFFLLFLAGFVSSIAQTNVDIRARVMKTEGSVTHARGEVEINTDTVRLNADEVDFRADTNQAEARGNVRMKFLPDAPNPRSSIRHYLRAEVFFRQNNYQSAANEFREALNGDLDPKWTEVWGHINLGKIFDITGQRERAVNEYQLAQRTRDNTQGAQDEVARYLKQPYERK